MEVLQMLILRTYDLFAMEFTIYGFTMSFLQICIWSAVACIVIWFIGKVFL